MFKPDVSNIVNEARKPTGVLISWWYKHGGIALAESVTWTGCSPGCTGVSL